MEGAVYVDDSTDTEKDSLKEGGKMLWEVALSEGSFQAWFILLIIAPLLLL